MSRVGALLAASMMLAACAATAQDARVFNFGNLSCKHYVDGAVENPNLEEREGVKTLATAWVMGYVTGRNRERPYDEGVTYESPRGRDAAKRAAQAFEAEVMGLVDAFCLANYGSGIAGKSLANAANHAVERLSSSKR